MAKCPRCKGTGSILVHAGRGYMRDGSFEHNVWERCLRCSGTGKVSKLIAALSNVRQTARQGESDRIEENRADSAWGSWYD